MTLSGLLRWSLAFLLAGASAALAADELPRGQVIERVVCAKVPAQAYALYLPSNYDAARRWPLLLCFDPGANGRRAVERFAAAAEKFGWIVAGSLNSRNGPWDANAAAINALVQDAGTRWSVDPRRLYAAGLSGGARVALQLALMNKLISGVIACSAGFPGSAVPDKVAFPVFGTAGLEDFNHNEMRRVDVGLADLHAPHRVVIFNGGHEWLPAPLAEEALAWLELHAIRAGTRPRDEAFLAAQFAARRAAVPPTPVEENLRALQSLAADFKGLADTAELEKQVAALARSSEVKSALKAERASIQREDDLVVGVQQLAYEGDIRGARREGAKLRAQADAPVDSPERRIARRVIAALGSGARDGLRQLMEAQEYGVAIARLELAAAVRPDRPQTQFDLARAYAFNGDRKNALAALEQALKLGFNDPARLASEPAFEKFRKDPRFAALAATAK
jgi:predicted esterase